MSKVVIVGAGFVGATTAFALMSEGAANEIVLIDKIRQKAEGESLDLGHGVPFARPVKIKAGEYQDCEEAEVIIVTGGAPQKPGQSRLDLVRINTSIMEEIISNVIRYNRHAILLIVTNPVDIMAYVAWKTSGLPPGQIIGSGTVLDTSRFRHLLSHRCNIDPRNIHTYVIGEHGDSEVLLWSNASIAGVSLDIFCKSCQRACTLEDRQKINSRVREAAYEIIEGKGATYYAASLAIRRIAECILRDEKSVLTVSTLTRGIYGLENIFLSLPSVVGKKGVERILPLELDKEEEKQFLQSAGMIKGFLPLTSSTTP